MTKDEIREIAVAVAKETAAEMRGADHIGCSFCTEEGRIIHDNDHKFLQDLHSFLNRLDGVRWGVLKGLIQTIVTVGVIGLIAFLWRHGVKG